MKRGENQFTKSYRKRRPKCKTIFTVHCRESTHICAGHRTFGWFAKLYDANRAVKNNTCDIYECSYTYAVVEEIVQGVFGPAIREWWWRWDKEQQKYLPIDKPIELRQVVNFGMG